MQDSTDSRTADSRDSGKRLATGNPLSLKVLSVNVSTPTVIPLPGNPIHTGIFKRPVTGPVSVSKLRLKGDSQVDLKAHGGLEKAVYVYAHDHYAYWARELGRNGFSPGRFGENLTVEGALEDKIHIGDIFEVGTTILQVTQPRQPCSKLAFVMGTREFPKRFLESDRVGFYMRVLQEGKIVEGDRMERIEEDPAQVSVARLSRLFHFDRDAFEEMRQALKIASLPQKLRAAFQQRLLKAGLSLE